jgi:hypothetical protein
MQHYSPTFLEMPKSTHTKDKYNDAYNDGNHNSFDGNKYPKMLPPTMQEQLLNKQSDNFDRFGLNTRSSRRDERIKTESARLQEIEPYMPPDLRVPKYINQSNEPQHYLSNGSTYSRFKKSNSDIDKPVNIRDLLPGTHNNILYVNDMKAADTRRMHKTTDISDREPMRHKLSVPPSCYPV